MSISVVQSKALDALASPAGNFDNPVTAGNCVVVLLFTWAAGNVTITTSGVTLGGSADNFAQAEAVQSAFSSATAYVGCWVDPACAGGQTAISATVSNGSWGSGGAGMILLELSGVTGSSPVDVTSSSSGTSGTAVTSGTTPATGTAADMAIGAAYPEPDQPTGGLSAASGTYANVTISAAPYLAAAGYLTLGGAGSTTSYTGTGTNGGVHAGLVITLKPDPGGGGGGGGALTFSGSYSPSSDWTAATSPKTQTTTAATGDLVVVLGGTADASTTLGTATSATGGPASWTLLKSAAAAGTCAAYAWSGIMPPPGALSVTTTSLPNGNAGTAYSQALAATGGTGAGDTWSVTAGSLPAWASLSAAGVITGTPSGSGSASFTVQVTDSGSNTATRPLTLSTVASTNPSWSPGGTWTLVFDDEFTGSSLDTTKWQPGWFGASGITPGVNSGSPQNNSAYVTVSGGSLNLKLDNSYGALVTTNPGNSSTATGFQIGYPAAFEARINVPGPFGSVLVPNWVAWWTDGQSWPGNGEIDILESLGTPDWNCAHVHDNHTDGSGGAGAPGITHNLSPPSGWHTFGANWTAGQVVFYYDGASIGALATDGFAGPHYLILVNTYNGSLDTPTTMQVDWVRVWTPG